MAALPAHQRLMHLESDQTHYCCLPSSLSAQNTHHKRLSSARMLESLLLSAKSFLTPLTPLLTILSTLLASQRLLRCSCSQNILRILSTRRVYRVAGSSQEWRSAWH